MAATSENVRVYTVGHSTHRLDNFAALLQHYGIELLVDVRSIPRSRHNPQFNGDTLPTFLQTQGIDYRHLKELGACGTVGPIRPTTAGAMPHSGDLPIICRPRPLKRPSRTCYSLHRNRLLP